LNDQNLHYLEAKIASSIELDLKKVSADRKRLGHPLIALIRNLLVSVAVVAQFGASAGTALVTAAEGLFFFNKLDIQDGMEDDGKG
jgi:hypothetical protein